METRRIRGGVEVSDRFDGAVVVVTGAGKGIGETLARRFAAEGAKVAVADIDSNAAEAVATSLHGAVALEVDVSSGSSVEHLVGEVASRLGPVDVLVNNAAIAEADGALVTDETQWDREIAVDLKGPFLSARAVLPSMIDRRAGVIVNIASVNGLGYFGLEAYSAAKAGLISLTRALATRYGPYGIRVNAVAPGSVVTPAWDKSIAVDPDILERLRKWYPLGRMGTPDDVADAVLFLASEQAAWITGVVLPVDGGLTAGNGVMTRELLSRTKEPFAPLGGGEQS